MKSYKCLHLYLFFLCPNHFCDLKNRAFGEAYEMFPGKPDNKRYELIATSEIKQCFGMRLPSCYYM